MAETLKFQFTNPATGLDVVDTARFDIVKYRKDDSSLPAEDFFFTVAAGTNIRTLIEIPDIVESAIVANPLNPYGCNIYPIIFGIVKYKVTTNSVALTQNPQTLGFTSGVPVAFLNRFDSRSPIKYAIPTSVTSSELVFASGDSMSTANILEGYVAVKFFLPRPATPNFTKMSEDWGVKSLMERPLPPTVSALIETNTIKVTLTPPITDTVIKQYYVYIIKSTEDFNNVQPIITGNKKPDLTLTPGDTTSIPITTYGGGTDAGGGTVITTQGSKYYVVAVAKDAIYENSNCSALSNIASVTF